MDLKEVATELAKEKGNGRMVRKIESHEGLTRAASRCYLYQAPVLVRGRKTTCPNPHHEIVVASLEKEEEGENGESGLAVKWRDRAPVDRYA